MKKTWILMLSEYLTKNSDDKEVKLEKGKSYEVDETVAESLIKLNLAKATEAPSDDLDVDKIVSDLGDKLTKKIEGIVAGAFDGVGEKLEKSIVYATPKGPDSDFHHELKKNHGWDSTEQFFKAVVASGSNSSSPGMEFLSKAPTGHSINNDESLGFLVPEPVSNRIWTNTTEEEFDFASFGEKYTTNGNSMRFNTLWETSAKPGKGQRNGGFTAYWEDEAAEHTASKTTVGRDSLRLNKLAVLTYATDEMLEDIGSSFGSLVNKLAAKAINYNMNVAAFDGSGVGKPLGFMNSDALVTVGVGNNAGRNITHENLRKMYWRNINRGSAIWFVHPLLAEELETIYFNDDVNNQRPVYLPANQITGSPFGVMYGRPVVPWEFMNSAGDLGDIAFVDPTQFCHLNKVNGGVKRAQSMHVRFLYDEMAFKWTYRTDLRPKWKAAKEDLKGTLKRSPYVTLADRTGGSTSSGL